MKDAELGDNPIRDALYFDADIEPSSALSDRVMKIIEDNAVKSKNDLVERIQEYGYQLPTYADRYIVDDILRLIEPVEPISYEIIDTRKISYDGLLTNESLRIAWSENLQCVMMDLKYVYGGNELHSSEPLNFEKGDRSWADIFAIQINRLREYIEGDIPF